MVKNTSSGLSSALVAYANGLSIVPTAVTQGTEKQVAKGNIRQNSVEHWRKLRPKQRAFVSFYLLSFNASRTARQAGYGKPFNVAGSKLLAQPGVRKCIEEKLSEHDLTVNFAFERQSRLALASIECVLDLHHETGKVVLNLRRGMESGGIGGIKRIRWRSDSDFSITVADAQRALGRLLRFYRLHPQNRQAIFVPPEDLGSLAHLMRTKAKGFKKTRRHRDTVTHPTKD
jgi:hypothetical protein